MDTSGTNILARSASDIVISALRRTRAIPVRQPVSSIDMETGIDVLNSLVAELKADGWHLWKSDEYVVFLDQGKTDYLIGETGDRAVLLDDLIQTRLATAVSSSDTQLIVGNTALFAGADNKLSFDPSDSVADWAVSNSGVSSVGGLLTILNTAIGGYAEYTVDSNKGSDYFFELDITANTGVVTLEVYSGLSITQLATFTVVTGGTQTIAFTATEASSKIRIVNDNVTGDTDVNNLLFRESDTGENVGYKVSNALREWGKVIRVINATTLELKSAVTNAATLNKSVVAYKNLPPRPSKIRNQRSKSLMFDSEIPVHTWSRQEYMQQTIKNTMGFPTQAYYNPELNNGRLYIWQTACDVDQIMMFTGDKPLEIFVENANSPDFPSEWFNMLSWGLASELGPEYGISEKRQAIIDNKAAIAKDRAESWDEESGSLLIGPDNLGV